MKCCVLLNEFNSPSSGIEEMRTGSDLLISSSLVPLVTRLLAFLYLMVKCYPSVNWLKTKKYYGYYLVVNNKLTFWPPETDWHWHPCIRFENALQFFFNLIHILNCPEPRKKYCYIVIEVKLCICILTMDFPSIHLFHSSLFSLTNFLTLPY